MSRLGITILLTVLSFFCIRPLCAEQKKVIAVLDFVLDGVTKNDGRAFCDLLSCNIQETGSYLVIDRRERDRLLRGAGQTLRADDTEQHIRETADLINADIVVTARLARDRDGYHFRLGRLDVHNADRKELALDFGSLDELVVNMREIAAGFFYQEGCDGGGEDNAELSRIEVSLVPRPVHERMLFVLPSGKLDDRGIHEREFLDFLLLQAAQARNVDVFPVYCPAVLTEGDLPHYFGIVQKENCHTLVCIVREGEKSMLGMYDFSFFPEFKAELFSESPQLDRNYEANEYFAGRVLHIPQKALYNELRQRNSRAEKLDALDLKEKMLKNHFAASVYYRAFSAAIVPDYLPQFNLASLNAGLYWYYGDLTGLGAEYGFSVGYPGTIEPALAEHPLITQFELRLIPFSFRTSEKISIAANLLFTFHLHNACHIVLLPGDVYSYEDRTWMFFVTCGVGFGLNWNLSPKTAIYFDLASINFLLYNDELPNDIEQEHPLSVDFGGIGFIYRF
ncbi:MAG: hypothetical protein JW874_11945 [Spirochaetales bacterium]|nr:hypothetical protein [Spirochaetales bacterium]